MLHRSMSAASAVSTSDHPIAPAFFTKPPETGVRISLAPSSEPLDPDAHDGSSTRLAQTWARPSPR